MGRFLHEFEDMDEFLNYRVRPLARYGWVTTMELLWFLLITIGVSGPSRGLGSFLHMSYTTDDPWPERFPPPLEAWVVSYLVSAGCLIVKGLSFRPLAKYGWGPTI